MSKNFRSKWKPILYIFIGLKISSCSSEESQDFNENQREKEIVMEQTTLKELGYDSHEDMMNDGWELLIPKNNKRKFYIENNTTELKKINEKITADHLYRLGYLYQLGYSYYGANTLLDLYAKYYNNPSPTAISVNDIQTATYRKAITTISNKYGWEAYIQSGEPKIIDRHIETIHIDSLNSTWVFNESHVEDRSSLSYSITKSKNIYWENTGSLAIAVGKEIGIPGLKGKVDITMGYSHTEGKLEGIAETISGSYWATLPPRTKRRIIFKKQIIIETIKCEIPILITGFVGAEFRSQETGNLEYKALPANLLLKNRREVMTYTIKMEKYDLKGFSGPVFPL